MIAIIEQARTAGGIEGLLKSAMGDLKNDATCDVRSDIQQNVAVKLRGDEPTRVYVSPREFPLTRIARPIAQLPLQLKKSLQLAHD